MMAETNVEKVQAVIQLIRAQNPDLAAGYLDRDFVQHYPYMAAGARGFREYITDSTPAELQLRIVRTIADGPYVVAQLKAESSGDDTFAVYRFQDGLIAEHWAFSAPNAPPNASGHTQVDGPMEPKYPEDTEKNKDFARRYYQTFHLAGDRTRNHEFFTGDVMIRHEPGVRDGLGEFLRDVEVLMKHRTIDEVKLLLGQGDLVFIAARGTHDGKPCAYIDLYRVDKEKVVEHWGFPSRIPSLADAKNANNVF